MFQKLKTYFIALYTRLLGKSIDATLATLTKLADKLDDHVISASQARAAEQAAAQALLDAAKARFEAADAQYEVSQRAKRVADKVRAILD